MTDHSIDQTKVLAERLRTTAADPTLPAGVDNFLNQVALPLVETLLRSLAVKDEALRVEHSDHVAEAEQLGMALMDGARPEVERAAIRGRVNRALKRAHRIRAALNHKQEV